MSLCRTLVGFAVLLFFLSTCRSKDDVDQKDFSALPEDQKRDPQNALSAMTVAPGLEVELFASEPMVTNPTNISVDYLGRVWVCEAYNYDVPPQQEEMKGDRISVLEDTDHNGIADKRTVFYQGTDVNTPLGIFVAGNQVYISRSPNVLILSDTDGDLVADRKDTLFTNLGKKGDHSAHSIFPGPDGKLYFSTGNMAGEIKDNNGNPIIDKAGFQVNQKGIPYLGGMVMRFDADGKNFEVLGHNFRNNYEPCIDSYGNIWQSDNDDDGNKSCRVNFIVPYGNYGYLDEMTRASWPVNRVGMEKEIPQRHWHQNDPGVIPNVLITGAGSPAGMTMYEGEMLPSEFHGVPIHAEPYYNVVRAYLPEKKEAGYTARIQEILKSEDQWFRPIDVATAPDGSLFVADWYDPILGGGAAGDHDKGRIYRISRRKNLYKIPAPDLSSVDGNIEVLKNPNPETRRIALTNLITFSQKSIPALNEMWHSQNSLWRVRAMWALVQIQEDDSFLTESLKDSDASIRAAAVRAVLQFRKNVVPYLRQVSNDPDKHVLREVATALRYANSPEAADLWVTLTTKYDGKDRWFLEALGVGSDLHADVFFAAWKHRVGVNLNDKAHQDIIWRVRSKGTLPFLAQIIANSPDAQSTHRFFRAFDFHPEPEKNQVLISLLNLTRKDGKEIASLALQQIDPERVPRNTSLNKALDEALEYTKGTLAFVDLIGKYNLRDKIPKLLQIAIENPETELSNAAIDQLIKFKAFDELNKGFHKNEESSIALLRSLKSKGNRDVTDLVQHVARDSSNSLALRQVALQTLGSSWPGEEKLLALVKDNQLSPDLKPVAASILFNVYRSSIQREAANYLDAPQTNGVRLPSIKELVASNGNPVRGEKIFNTLCVSCHRISQQGVKFGPELTLIGSKLSKDGLYSAILYPDEGISHGFASSLVTLQDGTQAMGIITNETDNELELSSPGGGVNKYSRSQIKMIEASQRSIMPSLAPSMSKQDLIDLVTYLSSLKGR